MNHWKTFLESIWGTLLGLIRLIQNWEVGKAATRPTTLSAKSSQWVILDSLLGDVDDKFEENTRSRWLVNCLKRELSWLRGQGERNFI